MKRGWITDELIKIGHLEAGMSHGDEQICYIKEQMAHEEEPEVVDKLIKELQTNQEMLAIDYDNRVASLNDIFDSMPNSDRHYYCRVKHAATAYVIACENYHARSEDPKAEESAYLASQSLALACSLAFGFEPVACARCLDEMIKEVGEAQ